MIENARKHIERETGAKPRRELLIEAAQEVGRPLFFSLLIITVSFLPIFTLEAQEGRLFRPLAFTKTFAMGEEPDKSGRPGSNRRRPAWEAFLALAG